MEKRKSDEAAQAGGSQTKRRLLRLSPRDTNSEAPQADKQTEQEDDDFAPPFPRARSKCTSPAMPVCDNGSKVGSGVPLIVLSDSSEDEDLPPKRTAVTPRSVPDESESGSEPKVRARPKSLAQKSIPRASCREEGSGSRSAEKAGKRQPAPTPPSPFSNSGSDFEDAAVTPQRVVFKTPPVKPSPGKKELPLPGSFIGGPFSEEVALARWPVRYATKDVKRGPSRSPRIHAHYGKAQVHNVVYELDDIVQLERGRNNTASEQPQCCIGRITEFFKNNEGKRMVCVRRFFEAHDTAIKDAAKILKEPKRVFYSEVQEDWPLCCVLKKTSVLQVPTLQTLGQLGGLSPEYYFDMSYDPKFSAFCCLPAGSSTESKENSTGSKRVEGPALHLLDLYCGCGAMSTGLCSGSQFAGVHLVTRWAVDQNEAASDSLQHNHRETSVFNVGAEVFFELIRTWQDLFYKYPLSSVARGSRGDDDGESADEEAFEIEKLLAVRMGEAGVEFKIRWKGYSEDHDTWQPAASFDDHRIAEFIWKARKEKILPLPGEVDVVCGGPPCQGISGFNRFRNHINPLQDEKNKQLKIFMDIVEFLKPRFVLMENVVDLLKFCGGYLGRYSLSRLVAMRYQAALGIMTAGCYGLPQFRMRAFLWGASSSEILPSFPLPTHEVANARGHAPKDWEINVVAYGKDCKPVLAKALVLEDAISDLPPVNNSEKRDFMNSKSPPLHDLQRFLRLGADGRVTRKVYDHKPLQLTQDDIDRVRLIPKEKGANFRNLEGVIVSPNNTARLKEGTRPLLSSGKPLVPDYALSYKNGKSFKPFGRLWWDEIVTTVVTRAEPHNQIIIHPTQDRVLTVRENARLQGFPDHYRLRGDTKERYKQVGNAVAVPVARALGYCLGLAIQNSPRQATIEVPRGLYSVEEST